MRKLVSVALALLLLFSLSVFPAWAAEGDPASSSGTSGDGSSGSGKQPSIQRSPTEEKSLAYWEAIRGSIQLTGDLRKDILIITRAQLGYSADLFYYEQEPSGKQRFYTRYGEWYGRKFSDWCDMFVCFCIYYAGGTDYPFEWVTYGTDTLDLRQETAPAAFSLKYLMAMYKRVPKGKFFLKNNFFEKLAGNGELRRQIEAGMSEKDIRATWQPALREFMKIREKYLIYK